MEVWLAAPTGPLTVARPRRTFTGFRLLATLTKITSAWDIVNRRKSAVRSRSGPVCRFRYLGKTERRRLSEWPFIYEPSDRWGAVGSFKFVQRKPTDLR
jgi:hypothetical protein